MHPQDMIKWEPNHQMIRCIIMISNCLESLQITAKKGQLVVQIENQTQILLRLKFFKRFGWKNDLSY